MNTFQVSAYGSDLASRPIGRKLRSALVNQASYGPVVLDFAGVRAASHSFADEFVAVLIEEKGEAWFRGNVKVINHTSGVRSALLDAIQHRLDDAPATA